MTPIGYARKSIGIFLAVAIFIGAGVLMAIFVSGGATFSDIKYLGIVACVLALLCIRIVASVCNPATGDDVIVTSELYSRNVDSFIKDGYVNIHYSPNGEYWVELSK